MDTTTVTRREAGLELRQLAGEFAASDEAAFRRTRIACWVLTVLVTIIVLVLLISAADWRYLLAVWAVVVALPWTGYVISSHRQRGQTERLRALADAWLGEGLEGSREAP